ncbi:MAG: peptidylprolyl isomerase [Bacteroidia bacterium]|nr:peptidylprolyl isomerase [Bacteroidia bacterium]
MKTDTRTVVSLAYEMLMEDGEVIDQISEEAPFRFIFGINQIFPALEAELKGLEAGQKFDIVLPPEVTYGVYDPQLVQLLAKTLFDQAPEGSLEVGSSLPMVDGEGQTIFGVITEVNDQTVNMDFNHPLAGQRVRFRGKVVAVRPATAVELDLGKVRD